MFRTPVLNTPFVGDFTDAFFSQITGESYQGDVSFLSTMRALLTPVIPKDGKINLRFVSSPQFKAKDVNDKNEFVTNVIPVTVHRGDFVVYNLRSDADAVGVAIAAIRELFPKSHKGFREVQLVAEFYSGSFPCICFANEKEQSVIYFVGRLNMRSMHYLQASIPVPLTWFIPEIKKTTFDEDSWALINRLATMEKEEGGAIVNNGADEYVAILERMVKKYDIERGRLTVILNDFEKNAQQKEIDNLRGNINQIDRQINQYMDAISDQLKHKDDLTVRIWGLEHKIETLEGESELLDYFLSNKALYLESVNGTCLTFSVGTYLTYIDPAALSKIMGNTRSAVHSFADNYNSISAEDMCRLLTASLIDGKIRMRMCAAYSLDIGGGGIVHALSGHCYPSRFDSYMRNIHIDRAACLGSYSTPIVQALRSANYVGAIEQCVASAMSQNVLESVTFNRLLERIYDKSYPHRNCFELPDGKVVSPEDAIKWLKEQEAKDEEEKSAAKPAAKKAAKEATVDE